MRRFWLYDGPYPVRAATSIEKEKKMELLSLILSVTLSLGFSMASVAAEAENYS
jgi:hypothetical protein